AVIVSRFISGSPRQSLVSDPQDRSFVANTTRRSLIDILIGIQDSPCGCAPRNAHIFTVALGICLSLLSCSPGPRYTEDPKSSVGGLRLELVAFARGQLESVIGKTEPDEAYILMYGYEKEL